MLIQNSSQKLPVNSPCIAAYRFNMEEYMQSSSDQELRSFCKELEAEMNQELLLLTNSLSFIRMASKAMEEHLDQIVAVRERTEQWLKCLDLPTRAEISDKAKTIIAFEDRLDRLDDTLYQIIMNTKEHKLQMTELALDLERMKSKNIMQLK